MNYKISFCTVCMNRLQHLKQTLLKNIQDNRTYENLEFVVLDYNSDDGLKEWIMDEMATLIESGKVAYYRTEEPKYFDRSHSRNIMFKLATGEIICNIDADNFTGEGFAHYINEEFNKNSNIVIVPDTKKIFYYKRDVLGRFCALKEDFFKISGYDETMSGYGFEDDDLYQRFFQLNREEVVIKNKEFLQAIQHDDSERIKNEFNSNNLHSAYINYLSPDKSDIILLYNNFSFEKGSIIPNHLNTPSPFLIENYKWEEGIWREEGTNLHLKNIVNNSEINLHRVGSDDQIAYEYNNNKYYHVSHKGLTEYLSSKLSLIKNQGQYLFNQIHRTKINPSGYGKSKIYSGLEALANSY